MQKIEIVCEKKLFSSLIFYWLKKIDYKYKCFEAIFSFFLKASEF